MATTGGPSRPPKVMSKLRWGGFGCVTVFTRLDKILWSTTHNKCCCGACSHHLRCGNDHNDNNARYRTRNAPIINGTWPINDPSKLNNSNSRMCGRVETNTPHQWAWSTKQLTRSACGRSWCQHHKATTCKYDAPDDALQPALRSPLGRPLTSFSCLQVFLDVCCGRR